MRQLKIAKQVTNRETASLDKYLQEIGRVDVITEDEEVELARRIKAGDRQAFGELERGWSALLLASFYYVVDVRGWRRWCVPFIWIGMNPITLYVASNVIRFRTLAQRFVGGDIKAWLDAHVGAGAGQGMLAVVGLGLMFVLARFQKWDQILQLLIR